MLCSSLVMSSCDTYTGSGAYAGGSIGSILGSAIGGLSGGPRGSDMGTIIGMAGGAVVGAVIGSQADKAQADRKAAYKQDRVERRDYSNTPVTDNPRSLIPTMGVMTVSMISRARTIPAITVPSSLLLRCRLLPLRSLVSDSPILLPWRLLMPGLLMTTKIIV